MSRVRLVRWTALALYLTAALLAACTREQPLDPHAADTLPERLSDSAYWALISESSERGGRFHSENFLSNERTFQHVIPALATPERIGRAYLGVGPEQNFTYIVALRPKIAFIVDIRRQNLQLHLMYKAIAELSPTRAEFLSRLFAQDVALDTAATPAELFRAVRTWPPDLERFRTNLAELIAHLRVRHGFPLDSADSVGIHHVYMTFVVSGSNLNYSSPRSPESGSGAGPMPVYGALMTATDGDGVNRAYLATEENYRVLRDLQLRNLVVPVTGNFAGKKALRAVGAYLRAHNAGVGAIYVSNVEQYLFDQGRNWKRYYANVGRLPVTPATTFIRSMPSYQRTDGGRLGSLLSPTLAFLDAYERGRIREYGDLQQYSTR
jgi:hypothetical protein